MAPHSLNIVALATTLEPTIGVYFLGAIASVGLSGVTTLQSWLYFQKYPQDPIAYKLLVTFTWTLEILKSCVTIHAGYYYSVQSWGNIPALLKQIWSLKVMVLLSVLIDLGVHCFFIHKVWKATHGRAKVLCSIIVLFVLGDFALGLASFITAEQENDLIEIIRGKPEHIAIGSLGCAIGADWLITFSLVQFFRESKTQFHRTNRTLNGLIFYAINVGLLISVTDVIVLVLSVVPWPTLNFYQLTVFEVVGNFYANTLLACLNARDELSRPSLHKSPESVGKVLDTPNYPGRVHLHVPQQTWVSSEVSLQEATLDSKARATMPAHAFQAHNTHPIRCETAKKKIKTRSLGHIDPMISRL